MKYLKSSVIAATLIIAGFPAVYAVAANPASTQLKVSGTIVGSTCTTTFPTSVKIPDINQSTFIAASVNSQLGSDIDVGNVVFTGCDGHGVTLTAKGESTLAGESSKGAFKYSNASAGTENPMFYTLGYSGGTTTGDFDLTGATSASFTAQGTSFPVKQTMKVMKNANITDLSKYTGDFTTTVLYTANYK
ncbi:hypothetical protein DRE43_25975 [Salmonella enterica subsp. enterica serovar Java]|uniref:Type 1 fimbrial protein n=1 Tax=Salmonella enterica TaxID=28901 RepID=A0A403T7W7_SALER|nr:hypothetical protein [Salmonella enterica]EBM9901478.1 hypothetical protein [Salmonella enterica subsp. enterica serovar Typhimurium]EBS0922344.1 hypothetical protein [Salmonella enterica subsp. enterica serovar Enteritidis]EBX2068035.1 hypothetical protein [Salmonella enterica subsp. enterica serovar Java]ECC9264818.1 hypothetical protein [Salmonella enterica subsp. diarizonae]EKR1802812.1 hypothetical protein [Salmonella enterica subsp. enterica serovar Dublin]